MSSNKAADHSFAGTATNPWTPAFNLNAQDEQSMPSPEAARARAKAQEVMAALKKGEAGDADKLMGERQYSGQDSLLPGRGLLSKVFGKKDKNKTTEGVDEVKK